MTTTILTVLLLTVFIEALTCCLRFGFDLQSTRDTTWLARFTFGLRIHHGYVGLFMMCLSPLLPLGLLHSTLLLSGAALFISDIIHHYGVLWPIVGRPEFHLVYPDSRLDRWRQARAERRLD
ncbi:MAG: hypothetical protein IT445_18055 [Phycisphaeraceae bacterium]|nr:hypothetical protein [Phycisphaeraceae bacterium]